ncbi:hypothetical protein [Dysgonomonas sp. 520]|uniref:hypothetical protein n=1 Tax=Dysgonomonas sp. 520 TaxID=2302931 RepID=UPI0013D830C5|nr:hypothetical protein [Dysgonomonas sp. 520]NDW11064.1 hypothetical protein [Dysgonomonas sp. 520]
MGKFVIHEANAAGEVAGFGWVNNNATYNSPEVIKDIPDNSISNKGKIGTSIPTPLARIELFNTAYDLLTSNKKIDISYKKIVSESLDLLQFLFEKGGTGDIKVESWGIREKIRELADSKIEGHRILADALTTAFDIRGDKEGNDYGRLGRMFIFSYKGITLGGYSPKTMTYTSPNLWNHIKSSDFRDDFVSEDGRMLFNAEEEVPFLVKERNDIFRKYLLSLVGSLEDNSFRRYILAVTGENRNADMARNLNSIFMPVAGTDGKLFFNNSPVDTSKSGLKMKVNPEVNFYKNLPGYEAFLMEADDSDGKKDVHPSAPLVLCQNEGTEYIYLKDKWSHLTAVDPSRHLGIAQRKLPINGKQTRSENVYPFVYINDFLEEAIVNLDYDINDKKFATCTKEYVQTKKDCARYLLPVRKEYFLFFTMEDLKKQMVVEELYKNEEIKVTLNIPINGNAGKDCFIPFVRTYKKDSEYPVIKYQTDSRSMMDLSIFPSYRVVEDENKTIWDEPKNQYEVQFTEFTSANSPRVQNLSFYPFKSIAQDKPIDVSPKERTNDAARSLYYDLNNIGLEINQELEKKSYSFDLIELTFDNTGYKTLIIPNWGKDIELGSSNKDFIFGVDFGTSNTHIAYSSKGGADPQPLVIEDQMMTLPQNIEHVSELTINRFSREFVPEKVEYPVKTASLEGKSYNAGDHLFSGINIGYMIEDEMMDYNEQVYHYQTDLKWAYQQKAGDLKAKSRVEAYCMQTIWMIRNKLLMNETVQCRLLYFTPSCMVDNQKILFHNAWKTAVDTLLRGFSRNTIEMNDIDEAVAPYYALVTGNSADVTETDNILNIDIGGGTTDIFYFKCRGSIDNLGYISSIMFAGNDIWGNGARNSNGVSNGIVKHALNLLGQNPPAGFEDLIKNCVKNSSDDASSILFKYDKRLGYTNILAHNNSICNILLVHYASIIYYVCDLLKKYELDIPDCISFTGKGSEYIRLFAQSTDRIEKITRALMLSFLGDKHQDRISNLTIKRTEKPKELTANGGVLRDQITGSGVFKMFADNPIFTVGTGNQKEQSYKNKDIAESELRTLVTNNFSKFIDILYDSQHLQKALSGSGVTFIEDGKFTKDEWKRCGQRSYDQALNGYLTANGRRAEGFVDSSIFFLTLKDTIYQMSQYI